MNSAPDSYSRLLERDYRDLEGVASALVKEGRIKEAVIIARAMARLSEAHLRVTGRCLDPTK